MLIKINKYNKYSKSYKLFNQQFVSVFDLNCMDQSNIDGDNLLT